MSSAPPILPSSFYGTVTVNGSYVADGTSISAWIDGIQYADTSTFTFEGKSVYTIEIPADNPSTGVKDGGEQGDIVDFKIGSEEADQSGTWHTGTNVEVNLTASTAPAAPIADFGSSSTSGVVPWIVNFTDLSTGDVTAWNWDFGDGGSSSAANPSYVYSNPGTYSVSLTVSGPGGTDTKTEQGFITVYEEIIADFSASPTSGDSPLMVNFSDLSSGDVTSWLWDFGDGGTSTLPNPSHEYHGPGGFTISLTVNGIAGSDTETKVDYILTSSNPAIIADFSASATIGDAPLTVSFTDLSWGNIDSWFWSFGDGSSSTVRNPVHIYLQPGVYTVSLQIANFEESDIEEKQEYITITEPLVNYSAIFLPFIKNVDE